MEEQAVLNATLVGPVYLVVEEIRLIPSGILRRPSDLCERPLVPWSDLCTFVANRQVVVPHLLVTAAENQQEGMLADDMMDFHN